MKKIIGLFSLLMALTFVSIGQISIDKNQKSKIEKQKQAGQNTIDAHKKAVKNRIDAKSNQIQGEKKRMQNANQHSIKNMSADQKTKYVKMNKEAVEALPLAKRAEAKLARIDKKVNVADMKSAGAQMNISGVKTRLNAELKSGKITESQYQEKMEKVKVAEQNLKAYRSSIRKGKMLLK